ncbi:MAG: hypothetical protein ABI438_10745 [Dermatophilaceae bacterium]
MRKAGRLIFTLVGIGFWSVVASSVAFAQRLPDPSVGVAPPNPGGGIDTGTSGWKYALIATLGVLLAVAVVGLVASLRHSRSSGRQPIAH